MIGLPPELGEPLLVIEAAERARWHQPIVYAWTRGEEILYVGCSYSGIERLLASKHEKLREFQPGDRLMIWACANPLAMEERLIRHWRPRYNKPVGADPCPQCGGRWKLVDRPAGRCKSCQERAARRITEAIG